MTFGFVALDSLLIGLFMRLIFSYLYFIYFSFFLTNYTFAEESFKLIQPNEFTDQFDQKIKISESTRWIIFSNEKESYEILTDFFKSKKMSKTESFHGYYIADISKMPRLISKYFAIPEMQKLTYSILLDQNNETENWPRKAKHFTLIKLKSLKMIEIQFLKEQSELESIWLELIN